MNAVYLTLKHKTICSILIFYHNYTNINFELTECDSYEMTQWYDESSFKEDRTMTFFLKLCFTSPQ